MVFHLHYTKTLTYQGKWKGKKKKQNEIMQETGKD